MRPFDVELTVLMPCLNEAVTLAACIRKARACIERLDISAEIVIADNGSDDDSREIALAEGARVVDVPVRGYGAALYHGALAARGRFIIMGDADGSYDFARLDAFIDQLRQGAALVMGNRFRGGIRPGAMPWKNRYIGTPALSAAGRLLFGCPVGDFNCGLRGMSREAFEQMNLQTTGMEFASEMIIKATLVGLRIAEVPTTLDKDGRNREPHLRPWRDGWRHLRFMLLYSPRWLFLYPGALLFLIGAISVTTTLVRARGPQAVAGAETLALVLASFAVLLGFQGVAFAFCVRIYALNEGLLPEDQTLQRLFRLFTLETGLAVGGVCLLLGLGGGVYAAAGLSQAGLNSLPAQDTLLVAIPSAAALCLGGQVVFTSFLMSFLGMRRLAGARRLLEQ
jgi:glycosyltransferase involved in cell wall biosynthesis